MPVEHPGPLKTKRLPDGRRVLLRELNYSLPGHGIIHVPVDEPTDFSSDPVGLLDWSTVDIAGVVHDRLYQEHTRLRWEDDLIWLKIACAGVRSTPLPLALLGWLGIRLFGWNRKAGYPLKWKALMLVVMVATVVGLLFLFWRFPGHVLSVWVSLLLLRNLCTWLQRQILPVEPPA